MINIRDIFRKSIVYIVASIEIWLFYNEGIGKVEKKTKLHIIVLPIIFVFFFQILFLIKRHRWATCIATCAIGFKVNSIHSDSGVVLCRYMYILLTILHQCSIVKEYISKSSTHSVCIPKASFHKPKSKCDYLSYHSWATCMHTHVCNRIKREYIFCWPFYTSARKIKQNSWA